MAIYLEIVALICSLHSKVVIHTKCNKKQIIKQINKML